MLTCRAYILWPVVNGAPQMNKPRAVGFRKAEADYELEPDAGPEANGSAK